MVMEAGRDSNGNVPKTIYCNVASYLCKVTISREHFKIIFILIFDFLFHDVFYLFNYIVVCF